MALKIVIYAGRLEHQRRWCQNFAQGLERHGITPHLTYDDLPQSCELAVFWAFRKNAVIARQRQDGNDFLVLENGFFGARTQNWASAGYNGLNGFADFMNRDSPPERWHAHFGDLMQPWRAGGEYYVIMGQVPGDKALFDADTMCWAQDMAARMGKLVKEPVFFRPHPKAAHAIPPGLEAISGSLAEILSSAKGVISYSSSSAVEAVLAGVPAVVCHKAGMAWPVATHAPEEGFITPDRDHWAWDLAYAQWSEEEFRNGTAWEHLRRKYV